ncbi:MAG: TIGR01777 family oxidoreductase [Acidobacteriia bacterium]|nr:TIGR01777 family oxidoreductase [Terriglobia bacterium]
MKALVTGASGFIGSALMRALREAGHESVALARRAPRPGAAEIQWDPAGAIDGTKFSGADAVVHLAGESVAGRWSEARKARILNSRVQGTQTVAASMARATPRPRVLVSASANGIYGDTADRIVTEAQPPGSTFLAEVGRQWENATRAASEAGIRVVMLRIGLVLSGEGGALPRMLPPFRMGVGGRLGDGRQWISWIALEDLLALILHALANESVRGPVNAVAPNPVTNAEFTRALGSVLHRPTLFPVPAFVVRTVFGEMGQELLLASNRALPQAALTSGFQFRYPEIKGALEHVLNQAK